MDKTKSIWRGVIYEYHCEAKKICVDLYISVTNLVAAKSGSKYLRVYNRSSEYHAIRS